MYKYLILLFDKMGRLLRLCTSQTPVACTVVLSRQQCHMRLETRSIEVCLTVCVNPKTVHRPA